MEKNELLSIVLKHLYDFTLENSAYSKTDYFKGKREGMLEIIEIINTRYKKLP